MESRIIKPQYPEQLKGKYRSKYPKYFSYLLKNRLFNSKTRESPASPKTGLQGDASLPFPVAVLGLGLLPRRRWQAAAHRSSWSPSGRVAGSCGDSVPNSLPSLSPWDAARSALPHQQLFPLPKFPPRCSCQVQARGQRGQHVQSFPHAGL